MISLIALVWCLCLLIYGIKNDFPLWAVIIQLLCVIINIPGTILYFGGTL